MITDEYADAAAPNSAASSSQAIDAVNSGYRADVHPCGVDLWWEGAEIHCLNAFRRDGRRGAVTVACCT